MASSGAARCAISRNYGALLCYAATHDADHELAALSTGHPEDLLFLPRTAVGRDPIHEKMLRPAATEVCWDHPRSRAFRNFTVAGIQVAPKPVASAEILYYNCLFENCEAA